MLLEEISLFFCRLLQRNFLIDLLLSSTLHHRVTFAERNHFVMNNVQYVLLCSPVYEIWLGQNGCEKRYIMQICLQKCFKLFVDG